MSGNDFEDYDKPFWWERLSDYLAQAGAGWLVIGVGLIVLITLWGKLEGLFKIVSALAAGQ